MLELFLRPEQRQGFFKAPFPWFGGKSRVAHLVWERFGNVPNYVEPFFGSGAVLLGRPHPPHTETVNDRDAYVSNFWRALQADPEAVAQWADWPVNECDLHARHRWLIAQTDFRERIQADPDYYDARIAGWWCWGICAWIGSGWCRQESKQRPHLADAGKGVHRKGISSLIDYFTALAERLRRVRVCCGDWTRVLGDSVTIKHGMTGVFLDPPYQAERAECYAVETNVSAAVRQWAIEHGNHPSLKIALCGYTGEHEMPENWEAVRWIAQGGYGVQGNGRGRANAERETIWFNKSCVQPKQAHFNFFSG